MPDSIFSKIIDGDIPCHRIYEDEHVLSFLDINPISRGHVLVIPKERRTHLHELSDDSAGALGRVLPRICRAVMQATGCTAYNLLQNNGKAAHQEVMHVHFHIIPRYADHGLGLKWNPFALEEAESLASAISAALD